MAVFAEAISVARLWKFVWDFTLGIQIFLRKLSCYESLVEIEVSKH